MRLSCQSVQTCEITALLLPWSRQYGAAPLVCGCLECRFQRATLELCLCCALVDLDYRLAAVSGVLCSQHPARYSGKQAWPGFQEQMLGRLNNSVKTLVKLRAVWGSSWGSYFELSLEDLDGRRRNG